MEYNNLPSTYKPLSPWAYFGLSVLFSVPLVGFIFLIVYSFDDSNLNRRNFARSYWCGLLVVLALTVIAVIIMLAAGVSFAALSGGMDSLFR